jgi:hypothetical protein
MAFFLPARVIGRWLRRSLLVAPRRRVETFWLDRPVAPRIPISRPLRIALVGPQCREYLRSLDRSDLEVARYDFFEQTRDQHQYPHVVVVDHLDLKSALRSLRDADVLRDLPVLIVVTGSAWKCARWASALPDGVALAAVGSSSAAKFLDKLTQTILDDVPLEQMVRKAARTTVRKGHGAILILDRYVNQALRREKGADVWTSDPTRDRELTVHIMQALYREGSPRVIPLGATLRAGGDYLVRVYIGNGPPADFTLGESKLLEIALQSKDFQLRSRSTQLVPLPADGNSSAPVYFAVKAPAKHGLHQMRVIAYRLNQMLQTAVMEVEVADREYPLGSVESDAAAKVEFSQTSGFHELESIPKRALTISVNRESVGTHSLMIKGQGAAVPLQLSETVVRKQLAEFRRKLTAATFTSSGQRRWPTTPSRDSEKFIRNLAYLGRDLHRAYFDSYDEGLADTLRNLSTSEDEVISIVRHDPRFAFPWTIFYDYQLPLLPPTAQVCFGRQNGAPCKHDSNSNVCCVRGFWGYRHSIEEIMGNMRPDQRIDSIDRPPRPGNLHYQVNPAVPGLPAALLKMAPFATPYTLGGGLVNTLWNSSQRPSLLLLLAHQEDGNVANRPPGSRIELKDATGKVEWFAASEIQDQVFKQRSWNQPNTLVLLLNCESVATGPATLSNFVTAFHQAHAGAVVGTEVSVYSDLMERFAAEFTEAMWSKGRPLGETLTSIRRTLLEEGNPLGFVFTSIGLAELRFK